MADPAIKVGDIVEITSGSNAEKYRQYYFQVIAVDAATQTARIAPAVFGGDAPIKVTLGELTRKADA